MTYEKDRLGDVRRKKKNSEGGNLRQKQLFYAGLKHGFFRFGRRRVREGMIGVMRGAGEGTIFHTKGI